MLYPPCVAVCVTLPPGHWDVAPDGRAILFETIPAVGLQMMYVGAIDGSSAIPLTPGVVSYHAKWSPKGDQLIVALANPGRGFALAIVNRDGSAYRALTNFADQEESPAWSPDGKLIAFDGFRAPTQQVWVMNADGSGARQLTSGIPKFMPFWNPKGSPTGALFARQAQDKSATAPSRETTGTFPTSGSTICRAAGEGHSTHVTCSR